MSAKRALVVDDSKSARAFLARILERYEITVDTAESAENAIEYLTKARPDVIFMDHLMPGMDGFQAVQSIKNNPRTATIPIMMYTSQEGELYLGQARALGAVGVLPKQIKPADVSKVLYDLRLVPDRRNREQSSFTPLTVVANSDVAADVASDSTVLQPNVAASASAPEGEAAPLAAAASLTPELRSLIETTIRAETAELRRAFQAGIDSQSDRILTEVRSLLPDPPVVPAAPLMPEPPRPSPWGWVAAAASLVAALGMGWMWWSESKEVAAMQTRVASLQQEVTTAKDAARESAEALAAQQAALAAPIDSAAGTLISDATSVPISESVPFGEVPLAGERVAAVRSLLERLATEGYRGIVEITTYGGRYCLSGENGESLNLAADDTPVSKCALVGNPFYDKLSPAERQSMEFANVAAQFRKTTVGAIDVRVVGADPRATDGAYPAMSDKLTAGEWNKAAAANNRIDIRLQPNG